MVDTESEWQFTFAFSVIEGPDLPIKCPKVGSGAMKQYYNFKSFYSIILIALVDSRYHFSWVSEGAHGNTYGSTDFQSTDLWSRIETGLVFPDEVQVVNGLGTPPLILGDGAFLLRTWIAKPYGDAALSEKQQHYFNYRGSRAKMVTEGAFDQIKSRFRVLHKKCESYKKTVKAMALAYVVLHNIYIDRGDLIPRVFDPIPRVFYYSTANKRRDKETIWEKVRKKLGRSEA